MVVVWFLLLLRFLLLFLLLGLLFFSCCGCCFCYCCCGSCCYVFPTISTINRALRVPHASPSKTRSSSHRCELHQMVWCANVERPKFSFIIFLILNLIIFSNQNTCQINPKLCSLLFLCFMNLSFLLFKKYYYIVFIRSSPDIRWKC